MSFLAGRKEVVQRLLITLHTWWNALPVYLVVVPFYIREFELDSLVFHETGGVVGLEFTDPFGSVVAIFLGLKRDDTVARGFGIFFCWVFTRCISPCCGMSCMPGCSLYWLYLSGCWGVKQKVWNLEFLRDPKKLNDDMN